MITAQFGKLNYRHWGKSSARLIKSSFWSKKHRLQLQLWNFQVRKFRVFEKKNQLKNRKENISTIIFKMIVHNFKYDYCVALVKSTRHRSCKWFLYRSTFLAQFENQANPMYFCKWLTKKHQFFSYLHTSFASLGSERPFWLVLLLRFVIFHR